MRWSLVALVALAIAGGYAVSGVVGGESAQVAHGKYLVLSADAPFGSASGASRNASCAGSPS